MESVSRHDLTQPVTAAMAAVNTAVHVDDTAGKAIATLRGRTIDSPILYVYAVDSDDRLCGTVPIRALLLSPPETPIRAIMSPRLVTLCHDETVGDALATFATMRLLALPVVDGEGRLLGTVDVQVWADGTFEYSEARRAEQLFQMLGVHVEQARSNSALRGFRDRMPWLFCNIAGGLCCAAIGLAFTETLKAAVAVALFLPLVLTLAESVSMQSLSLVLQVLGDGATIDRKQLARRLSTEASTSLLLGLACGGVVATVSLLWEAPPGLPMALFLAIVVSMAYAAGVGALIPPLGRAFKVKTSVAAGPLALAFADLGATVIYLAVATAILLGGTPPPAQPSEAPDSSVTATS
jgi:magnesium transporter